MRPGWGNLRWLAAVSLLVWLVLGWHGALQASVPAAKAKISLKPAAVVDGNVVRLHHVAEITSEDAELTLRLGALVLAPAPPLGQRDFLDLSLVREKLERRRWAHGVVLEGAQRVEVTRAATRVSAQELEKIGLNFLYKHMPWKPHQVRVVGIRTNEVLVPRTELSFEVTPQRNEDYIGEVLLLITIRGDGRVLKQTWWRGQLEVSGQVIVAGRFLERGHVISRGDVKVKPVTLNNRNKKAAVSLAAVLGKKLKRRVRRGEIIQGEYLEDPPLIKRGDLVTVVAESKLLRVSTKGVAKEDGRRGESIRVMNLSSRKEIIGWVAGSSLVKVVY